MDSSIHSSTMHSSTMHSSTMHSSAMHSSAMKHVHKLHDEWTLWAHLPHDTDWSVKSYNRILNFNSAEAAIALCETIPEKMVNNCMLFLMRKGIAPTWEDAKNKNGGCFSYKVSNKMVANVWKNLSYILVGENLTDDKRLRPTINGITISPKKSFCIIKIWLATCEFQNPTIINEINGGINPHGCLFKKHLG